MSDQSYPEKWSIDVKLALWNSCLINAFIKTSWVTRYQHLAALFTHYVLEYVSSVN